jgi:hypothetical protein
VPDNESDMYCAVVISILSIVYNSASEVEAA